MKLFGHEYNNNIFVTNINNREVKNICKGWFLVMASNHIRNAQLSTLL